MPDSPNRPTLPLPASIAELDWWPDHAELTTALVPGSEGAASVDGAWSGRRRAVLAAGACVAAALFAAAASTAIRGEDGPPSGTVDAYKAVLGAPPGPLGNSQGWSAVEDAPSLPTE